MTRLIDADALKDDILKSAVMIDDRGIQTGYEIAIELIKRQPTVDIEPHWIPCSERLPDDNATVLITHRGGVSFGWYNGRYWERGANTKHRPLQTVTAWMPLPEPYEVEQ